MDQAEQRGAGGLVGACPCVLILLCPTSTHQEQGAPQAAAAAFQASDYKLG